MRFLRFFFYFSFFSPQLEVENRPIRRYTPKRRALCRRLRRPARCFVVEKNRIVFTRQSVGGAIMSVHGSPSARLPVHVRACVCQAADSDLSPADVSDQRFTSRSFPALPCQHRPREKSRRPLVYTPVNTAATVAAIISFKLIFNATDRPLVREK